MTPTFSSGRPRSDGAGVRAFREDLMADDKKDERRTPTTGPGTTSDPNQSNREPARDRGAEQTREAPVDPRPAGRDPARDRDDAAGPRHD